ncbi:MAG: hypothetical protein ABIL68_04805, partial [bacterium]
AWKQKIELRHTDGSVEYFDLSAFEQSGKLEKEYLINGGDIIFVPPIQLGDELLVVEGDRENSGTYQILPEETILNFLQRIRALRRNTELSKIMIVRSEKESSGGKAEEKTVIPFASLGSQNPNFILKSGDRIVLPSNYVYVKGAVQVSGAYPYILNLRARDYAGMAGGDYRSGSIKSVRTYHVYSGKEEKGPDVLVEPGDVVHLDATLNERLRNIVQLIPILTSLILAAKAAGIFGE